MTSSQRQSGLYSNYSEESCVARATKLKKGRDSFARSCRVRSLLVVRPFSPSKQSEFV
jgi:hypothetical protein